MAQQCHRNSGCIHSGLEEGAPLCTPSSTIAPVCPHGSLDKSCPHITIRRCGEADGVYTGRGGSECSLPVHLWGYGTGTEGRSDAGGAAERHADFHR